MINYLYNVKKCSFKRIIMKKFAFILLLVLSIFRLSYSEGLNSVFSKDFLNVWAVGLNGYVIHSTSAGNTWTSAIIGNNTLYSVFVTTSKIFITSSGGLLYTSVNNGASWDSVNVTAADIKSIFFIDDLTGWICCSNGAIFKTTNNGVNWIIQNSGVSTNLNSIKFLNSSTGVSCGSNGKVLVTSNGGINWVSVVTPVNQQLLSVDLKNNTIMACGENEAFIKSTNLGNSWTQIDYKIITKSNINCVYMFDENHYFSCGGGGFVRESTDGGVSFSFKVQPMLAELKSIFFYDNTRGWAVSNKNNVVVRTSTGGNGWSLPFNSNVTYNFLLKLPYTQSSSYNRTLALNAFNRNVMYAASGNKIYRSPDIGETWSQIVTIPYGTICQQFLVSTNDTNKMLAIMYQGAQPEILRTSNYGLNWTVTSTRVCTGHVGNLIAMDPNHPDTLLLGCVDSVFRSIDFGNNWTKISVQPINFYCDILISYQNSDTVFLTGSHFPAKFYESTNGGYSWFITDLVAGDTNYSEMPGLAISTLNKNLIYHTISLSSNQDGVRKTNNQGYQWQTIRSDNTAWGIDIAKDDPNCMSWGNEGSDMYITFDGGSSFIETQIPNSSESVLYYDRATIFAVQGNGVYKSNFTYNNPIGIEKISSTVPVNFSLSQNYPNPFNPETNIQFEIPKSSSVKLTIYNLIGKEIVTLINEELNPGIYKTNWNAENYPSGVYFYKLETENFSLSKKMILLK